MKLFFIVIEVLSALMTQAPRVYEVDGSIYLEMDGQTTVIAEGQFYRAPVLAPDASAVIYQEWTPPTVARWRAVDRYDFQLGPKPNNLWRYDIASEETVLIAGQPESDLLPDDPALPQIEHSLPVWSPDGAALAWTQLLVPAYDFRLVVWEEGEARVVVEDLPTGFQDQTYMHPRLEWGPGGIAMIRVAIWNGVEFGNYQTLTVYDPANGDIIFSDSINDPQRDYVLMFEWQGDEILLDYGERREWLDITTGERRLD